MERERKFNTNMIIFGIHGKKRTGKDTLCNCLLKQSPLPAYRKAFADALKLEVAGACGVTTDIIEQHKDNFRLILQGWGTDFRRKMFGDDYWINIMKEELSILEKIYKVLVIPDIRFRNEYDFIKRHGGIMIKITRNSITMPDNHESERTIGAPFNETIDNNGDIKFLGLAAEMLINKYVTKTIITK